MRDPEDRLGCLPRQMIPILEVIVPPLHRPFLSPGSAIADARSHDLKHRPPDLESCTGRCITDVRYCDLLLVVDFDNDRSLIVQHNGDAVGCAVVRAPPKLPTLQIDGDEILLRTGQFDSLWPRKTIAQSLMGRVFDGLFVGLDGVFIYARGNEVVSVHRMTDRNGVRPFLFWWLGP